MVLEVIPVIPSLLLENSAIDFSSGFPEWLVSTHLDLMLGIFLLV